MADTYKVIDVRNTLAALKHLINSYHFGASLLKDEDTLSVEILDDMQRGINDEFKRLKNGLETSIQANHAKTRPEPGTAPFCHHKPECNNGEGCDSCLEFELWADGYKE